MLRVTLQGIRSHLSRLIAVSLAATIAIAFLSATFILNSTTVATLGTALGQSYARADLVVTPQLKNQGLTQAADLGSLPTQLSTIPGVQDVFAQGSLEGSVLGQFVLLANAAPASLNTLKLNEGRMPEARGEFVVEPAFAKTHDLQLGSPLAIALPGFASASSTSDTSAEEGVVVGIAEASQSPTDTGLPIITMSDAGLQALMQRWYGAPLSPTLLQIKLATDGDRTSAHAQIEQLVAPLAGLQVVTPDQYVAQRIDQFSGSSNFLLMGLLIFVTIALFVAGLVISNTFSVLVAQRTRELALLRCIGASSRQVFRSVILEALAVAIASGVAGVLLAFGIMRALVWWGEQNNPNTTFAVSWQAIVWPVLVGVLVVLVAAIGPARSATRVSPVSAMRPVDTPTVHSRAGKARWWFGFVLLSGGGALLSWAGFGFNGATGTDTVVAPLVAIVGAVLSFVGVLLLMVFAMPAFVRALSHLSSSSNVPVRLAGLNGARNPRRTASTASALLIGVTLVTTVYVGASVASASLNHTLDEHYPIDLQFWSASTTSGPEVAADGNITGAIPLATLSTEQLAKIQALSGVEHVEALPAAYLNTKTSSWLVTTATPEQWSLVSPIGAEALANGAALVPVSSELNTPLVLQNGAHSLTLTHVADGSASDLLVLSPEQFASLQLDHSASGSAVELGSVGLIKLKPNFDATTAQDVVQQINTLLPQSNVSGAAMTRAIYSQVIQTLLLIMTGLLAVAVLIAVIGIGNTLALSVIERTRENALLRALGLTKGQLRGMLSAESVLIALSAAALGVLLGIGYGYLGSAALLSPLGQAQFALPWLALAVVVVAAIVAGFLASVLPVRRAARLSPIQGLAVD